MARLIGTEIPPGVRELLDGTDLAGREGLTFLLLTAAADGWPHLALLGVGELLAVDARRLRLGLWPGSTTSRNLSPEGRATLAVAHDGAMVSLRLDVRRVGDLTAMEQRGRLAAFVAVVEAAYDDATAYAVVEAGVRYRLTDTERPRVLERWAETIDALRGMGGAEPLLK